jgi:hypothetical protein
VSTLVVEGGTPGSLLEDGVLDVSRLVLQVSHDTTDSAGIYDCIRRLDAVALVFTGLVRDSDSRLPGLKLIRV